MFNTEKDLRNHRLRLHTDEDGTLVATCRAARLRRDCLYFHGPGVLGIYYEAPTRLGATSRLRYWLARLREAPIESTLTGDFDGIVLFRPRSTKDIPRAFFRRRTSTLTGVCAPHRKDPS